MGQEKAKWENQVMTLGKSHLEEKSSLEKEKIELEKEIEGLSSEIQQIVKLKSNNECNEDNLKMAEFEIDKLKKENESFFCQIDELNNKFTKDSAAFEEIITSYTKEIQVLKDEKLRIEKKFDESSIALEQSNEAKSTMEASIKSQEENLQKLSEEKEQLREKISGLK